MRMRILNDAALPPIDNFFSHLPEILLLLCLVAIVASVTVVLIVFLKKRKKNQEGK